MSTHHYSQNHGALHKAGRSARSNRCFEVNAVRRRVIKRYTSAKRCAPLMMKSPELQGFSCSGREIKFFSCTRTFVREARAFDA
jgi:hypothetical protein